MIDCNAFTKMEAFCENTKSIEDLVSKMNNAGITDQERNMIAGIYSYVSAHEDGLADESTIEKQARLLASLGGLFEIEKAVEWAKKYQSNESRFFL